MNHQWKAGQSAAIGVSIVTIDRVTPKGRAIVGNRQFRADGMEIGGRKPIVHLRPLTPEIQEEIETYEQAIAAQSRLYAATDRAQSWIRHHSSSFRRAPMTREEIATANRLAEAIETALKDET